jgi:hypothetical protein
VSPPASARRSVEMTRRLLLAVLAFVMVPAAGAQAAGFGAPVELGHGDSRAAVAAATDDLGSTTAIMVGVGRAQLVQRPGGRPGGGASTAWPPAEVLPSRLAPAVGPSVAAAGQGAAAVVWRLDEPQRFAAIVAMARDAGGTFGAPVVVSGAAPGGVRYPVVAVDAGGDVALAYNTNTRAVHLSLGGAVAVVLRSSGGSFGAPIVVDAKRSSAKPAIALGPGGRGVVAWVRERRVWAASIDAVAGTVGRPVALTRAAGSYRAVAAAAGPDGEATVAWRAQRRLGPVEHQTGSRVDVEVARRPAGVTTFPRTVQTIAPVGGKAYIYTIGLASDAGGRTTLAWNPTRVDPADGRSLLTTIQAAVAGPQDARFGPARVIDAPAAATFCDTPSVAATSGRSVLAWGCNDRRNHFVRTAPVSTNGVTKPRTVLTYKASSTVRSQSTPVVAGLDATFTTTIVATTSASPGSTAEETRRVVAITGR